MAAPGWTLADYREAEALAAAAAGVWRVRIVPPAQPELVINPDGTETTIPGTGGISGDLALWAVQRWGLRSVGLTVARGKLAAEEAREQVAPLVARFADAQVSVRVDVVDGDPQIKLVPFGPTPAQRRAVAAARAAAAAAPQGTDPE